MNINFGMDNFYVRYLKRFLASEMQQTNSVLGEFDKDDQKLLIQYLNLPNVESMSKVQRELNKRFPQLKSLFITKVQDDYILFKSKDISYTSSQWIMENIDDIKDYCTSVGWELADAHEWIDDRMDVNSDGVVDEKDRTIVHELVYNEDKIIEKGRITGKVASEIPTIDYSKFGAKATLYNSYNQLVGESDIEQTNNTYLFKNLDQGTYKVVLSAPGYLNSIVNNVYVRTGFLSEVQEVTLIAGDVDGNGIISIDDYIEVSSHVGDKESDANYSISCDLNRDGEIGIQDKSVTLSNKGKVTENLYWVTNQTEIKESSKYSAEIREKADINLDGYVDEKDIELLENYIATGRPYFSIKSCGRKNVFPNQDMLIFVNQFDGSFLYNYAINDYGAGVDNLPHKNSTGLYKIALYQCKPNQKITIAHNNTKNTRLVIGSSSARLKQDIPSFMLQNVEEVYLNPRRKLSISS